MEKKKKKHTSCHVKIEKKFKSLSVMQLSTAVSNLKEHTTQYRSLIKRKCAQAEKNSTNNESVNLEHISTKIYVNIGF